MIIVHRAWIAGLATAVGLTILDSSAEPLMLAASEQAETPLSGDPGCGAAERCGGASRIVSGSVVLDRGAGRLHDLALVAQGWGMSYRDHEVDVAQGIASLGVRAYVTDGAWLQVGVGAAAGAASSVVMASALPDGLAPAAMGGAGVELTGGLELAVHGGTALEEGRALACHLSLGLTGRY